MTPADPDDQDRQRPVHPASHQANRPIGQHPDDEGSQRLDKWLWAARFFKTRPLAVAAINGGRVQVDGQRVKPGRAIRPGARLTIHKDTLEWQVEVRALARQRRPASEAVLLYHEDDASRLRRQEQVRLLREGSVPGATLRGRPSKRDRRQLDAFRHSS